MRITHSMAQAAIISPGYICHRERILFQSLKIVPLPAEDHLRDWIRQSLAKQQNILATSNQGTILFYQQDGVRLIIKTAMGRGLMLWIRQRTLQREFRAYRQLQDIAGIPACYGFIDKRYLLLEPITGQPFRNAEIADREQYFDRLLAILQAIHGRKVAHGDLKSKGNLLVTEEQQPCVIDFGTAFRQKPGFHPINNWFFKTAKRLDLNAWVKHKYQGHYSHASPEDARLLHYNWLEILLRRISGRPMERVFRRSDAADE